ncbi:rhodanese-like domain-containing protein [Roseateles violae]|uniref:Rhodanese-like domain-containing protein n=1 Tax=Roseateles violae TaxID=3058042 RepID=A0ABT8DYL0_9BURK|nr:rhodanese-like domain-containing protein [Pelomonas sp. PFR6]MDN3922667.1 rhodanese-like domain-containing protein [Pelomonas sp. PFR6]
MTLHAQGQPASAGAIDEEGAPLPANALLIDVRSYAEYMSGHLPGALSLPLPQLEQELVHKAPDPRQPIVVYCSTGARAEQALSLLQQLGYADAHNGGGAVLLSQRLRVPLRQGL